MEMPDTGISPQERADEIITEWKKRRKQDEKEVAEKFSSPEYKEIFKQLAEENEQRKKRNAS